MKKSIYYLAVGCVLALSACTNEELVQESARQSNAIGFQNVVGKETRALTSGTGGNFNKFYVYGYYTQPTFTSNPVSVFDGEAVTLQNGAWSYENTRYWVPGATYRFYAYSCQNNTPSGAETGLNLEGETLEARALKITGYTTHNHHDLIFATNDGGIVGQESENGKVSLTFKHILSKINVVFDSEFASGYDIVVKNVSIQNIYDKANYNPYGTPTTWSNASRTSTDETNPTKISLALLAGNNIASAADPNNDENSVEVKATTEDGYVIPHEYSTSLVKLVFTIDVKQGNDIMFSRTLTGQWSPNWVEGKAYTYNVKINGTAADLEPIVFETSQSIDGWGDGDTSEVNMSFSAN